MTTITFTDREGKTIEVECDSADLQRLVLDRADRAHPIIVGTSAEAPEFTVTLDAIRSIKTYDVNMTHALAYPNVTPFDPRDERTGGGGFAVSPIGQTAMPLKIHAPPPTSARWEGPAPKQRRG